MGCLPDQRVLVLIGLRGSGKSTLGRQLAARQGRPFVDLDDVTAAFLGCDGVREAWERFGEAGFREAEARALAATLHLQGAIVALGGGTPTAPGAAELLRGARDAGKVVIAYLRCEPAELRGRLERAGSEAMQARPTLTGKDPLEEIEEVFARRDPLYRELACALVQNLTSAEEGLAALEAWTSWAR